MAEKIQRTHRVRLENSAERPDPLEPRLVYPTTEKSAKTAPSESETSGRHSKGPDATAP